MDFSQLPGFDIEADLAPLTALHNASTAAVSNQQQTAADALSNFQFSNTDDTFDPNSNLNSDLEQKVFFITNCGSLLGRTIAQVALDRGHLVAACAREKHLADLSVDLPIDVSRQALTSRLLRRTFPILVL
jgi:hypothetical protein